MTLRFSPLLLLAFVLLAAPAQAQRGSFGIGGQVGDPTGLTLKFGSGARAFDLAAGWDLDDGFFVQGHLLLRERRFPGAGTDLRYFYGPGLFLGARDRGRGRDDDVAFGFSFNAGISYYTGPVEIFGQLTPRLALAPSTDFDLGAGIGVRFYP